MHGLINRSIECFISDTYGSKLWADVASAAGLGFDKFESMLEYDDAQTYAVLDAAADLLSKPRDTILEDIGTYLVSDHRLEAVRRLLRFGGVTFVEFLHSLDDLNERAKLAVPELELPRMTLHGHQATGGFTLHCAGRHQGFARVLMGLLRTMADDYGALVFLEYQSGQAGYEEISILLVETSFADGRVFDLAGTNAGRQ